MGINLNYSLKSLTAEPQNADELQVSSRHFSLSYGGCMDQMQPDREPADTPQQTPYNSSACKRLNLIVNDDT